MRFAAVYSIIQISHLFILAEAWHHSNLFNFTVKIATLANFRLPVKVFESTYLADDYFALISSNRNNFLNSNANSIIIGARYVPQNLIISILSCFKIQNVVRNYLYQLSLPDLKPISVIKFIFIFIYVFDLMVLIELESKLAQFKL